MPTRTPLIDTKADAGGYRLNNRLLIRAINRLWAAVVFAPKTSFGEFALDWIEKRKATHPKATWQSEESRLLRIWVPHLRNRPLQSITAACVERHLDELVEKEALSPATFNRHRALLHRLFNDSIRAGILIKNPVSSIPPRKEQWKETTPHTLTIEEVELYLRTAKRLAKDFYPLASVLAWSGVRAGEALALRWSDITDKGIFVRRILDKATGTVQERTKGQRAGGGYVAMCLPRIARLRRGKHPDALVGNGLTYNQALKIHNRIAERIGKSEFTLHGFRHSFARNMLRMGFSRDDIRDCLGHESALTTDRYTHMTTIEHIAKRAKRLRFGE